PLVIILIVPMTLLSAIAGVWVTRGDNNVFTQIGLLVLVGLACKNAILIVEFARDLERQGRDRLTAALEASRIRLRPILMTSFAFIMGVVPLVIAKGAGAEMRRVMGIAVFSGMLGVTFFGLLFTPVFYVLIRGLESKRATHVQAPSDDDVRPLRIHERLRAAGTRDACRWRAVDLGPPLPGVARAWRLRTSMAQVTGLTRPLPQQDLYDVGFDASWEIDVFGRVNRTVNAYNTLASSAEHSL